MSVSICNIAKSSTGEFNGSHPVGAGLVPARGRGRMPEDRVPMKTHEYVGLHNKIHQMRTGFYKRPTCSGGGIVSNAQYYQRRGGSCARPGKRQNAGRLRTFYVKTIKREPSFIHVRPVAILGITFYALGRAQDPPLRSGTARVYANSPYTPFYAFFAEYV